MKFLGHIVGKDGIKVDPEKIEVVRNWQQPTDVADLGGLANYFRKFIQGYSSLVAPLTDLLRKQTWWKWSIKEQAAFEHLKESLCTAPVLAHPDWTKPFELISDASLLGTGAVLLQEGRPIAFTSK